MKRLNLLALSISLLMLTGCANMFLPIGTIIDAYITWKEGEAHAYFASDHTTAYNATKRSLAKLEYTISEDEKDSSGNYYIVAGGNDRFKIKVVHIEPYVTKISIRVNFMGDKPYAELIYKNLEKELDVIDYPTFKKRRSYKEVSD